MMYSISVLVSVLLLVGQVTHAVQESPKSKTALDPARATRKIAFAATDEVLQYTPDSVRSSSSTSSAEATAASSSTGGASTSSSSRAYSSSERSRLRMNRSRIIHYSDGWHGDHTLVLVIELTNPVRFRSPKGAILSFYDKKGDPVYTDTSYIEYTATYKIRGEKGEPWVLAYTIRPLSQKSFENYMKDPKNKIYDKAGKIDNKKVEEAFTRHVPVLNRVFRFIKTGLLESRKDGKAKFGTIELASSTIPAVPSSVDTDMADMSSSGAPSSSAMPVAGPGGDVNTIAVGTTMSSSSSSVATGLPSSLPTPVVATVTPDMREGKSSSAAAMTTRVAAPTSSSSSGGSGSGQCNIL